MSMYTFSATRARAFWSAERCFTIRLSPTWTRWRRPVFRPSVRTLYLDFDTDLYDLGGRNPEIRGREIGVEVHHREQGFSPDSHAGCVVGEWLGGRRDPLSAHELCRAVLTAFAPAGASSAGLPRAW